MTRNRDHPAFLLDDPQKTEALRQVAEARSLTLFVGAGVSIESALPDWYELVHRLLCSVGVRNGLSPAEAAQFAVWTIERDGITASGAVAQIALGTRFYKELARLLYRDAAVPLPGEMAISVARLAIDKGLERVEIVTTNYDLLLERALEEELERAGIRIAVQTAADGKKASAGAVVVRHLHGALRPNGSSIGQVVLSESKYHKMQRVTTWQERFFEERLRTSTCLFVGSSLTDPNLLRYLHAAGSAKGEKHLAVFARQQDASMYDGVAPSVASLRESTSASRWSNIGVKPVQLGYYAEIAQFLHEAALRCTGEKLGFGERMTILDSVRRRRVLSTGTKVFASTQDENQAVLGRVILIIRELLEDGEIRLRRNEKLGCSLWAYDPRSEELVNWFMSDRAWRDPRTLEPIAIRWDSEFVTVKAFCTGSLVSFSTESQTATRWNHVLALPLYSDGPVLGRLPVGALAITSTLPEGKSALSRGSNYLFKELRSIQKIGAWMLGAE